MAKISPKTAIHFCLLEQNGNKKCIFICIIRGNIKLFV